MLIRYVPGEGDAHLMSMREWREWLPVLETGADPLVARLTFKGSPWGRALSLGNEGEKGGWVSNAFAHAYTRSG